jgi:hypothetical protein
MTALIRPSTTGIAEVLPIRTYKIVLDDDEIVVIECTRMALEEGHFVFYMRDTIVRTLNGDLIKETLLHKEVADGKTTLLN